MKSYIAALSHPQDLADGRVVAPGEVFDLDPEAEHNRRLIESGAIVEAHQENPKNARRTGSKED